MPNTTSQVQNKRRSEKLPALPAEVRLALEKDIAERLEAERYPVFLKAQTAKRAYPGEAEALHLLLGINLSSKPKREVLLRSLRILKDGEEGYGANPRAKAEIARLQRTILSDRSFMFGVRREGLVVQPGTEKGMTAFALLSLFEQRRLSRLRKCQHCQDWFYARFKHQQFCRDPMKKCQWSHYHTPEWRRQHREQNKQHQRAYRTRLFGKGERVTGKKANF